MQSTIADSSKLLRLATAQGGLTLSFATSGTKVAASASAPVLASRMLDDAKAQGDEAHLIRMVHYDVSFKQSNNAVGANLKGEIGIRWSTEGVKGSAFGDINSSYGLLTCHLMRDVALTDEYGATVRDMQVFCNPVTYPDPILSIKPYELYLYLEGVAGDSVPFSYEVQFRAAVYYLSARLTKDKMALLRARFNRQ